MDCEELCEGCRKIDFIDLQRTAKRRALENHEVYSLSGNDEVFSLSYIREDSPCPLCRFLLMLKPSNLPTYVSYCCLDIICPSLQSDRWAPLKKQDTVFCVHHDGDTIPRLENCFTVNHKGSPGPDLPIFPPMTPDLCDWTQIKQWIDLCHKDHGVHCAAKSPSFPLSVIDCETRRIVRLPSTSTPYVTLSYVWGSGGQKDHVANGYLKDAPRTIEDSIRVVLELGYRFLWIDRYCIPQDDGSAQERHRLIQSMGQIYGGSAMTLIAAAGENPNYGLPGVSPGMRHVRAAVQAGPWIITPQVPSPVEEVGKSTWNTRGWTYQEAWLSRRRLAFTDSQMYFQCQHMHCLESISHPMKSNISLLQPRTEVFNSTMPSSRRSIIARISEFVKRRFSYDSDVLDGFAGILEHFREQQKVDNLLGLPIFYTEGNTSQELTSTDALTFALMWRCRNPSERRHAFPSWTWAGWKFQDRGGYFHISALGLGRVHSLVSLFVKFPTRGPIAWEGNQAHIADLCQETKARPSLVVRAFTFAFDRITTTSRNNQILWSGSTKFHSVVWGVDISQEGTRTRSLTAAVMLQHTFAHSGHRYSNPRLLIMQKISDLPEKCRYERIGVAERCQLLGENEEDPRRSECLEWCELVALTNATMEEFELV